MLLSCPRTRSNAEVLATDVSFRRDEVQTAEHLKKSSIIRIRYIINNIMNGNVSLKADRILANGNLMTRKKRDY